MATSASKRGSARKRGAADSALNELRAGLEPTLLQGSPEQIEHLLGRVLFHELSREALRIFEASSKLSSIFPGRASLLDPRRTHRLRIWLARVMLRAGYFRHGRKLIRSAEFSLATDHQIGGIFEMAFGNIAAALGHFDRALKLEPKSIGFAGSYLHALAHAGDPAGALRGLRKLLDETPKWDERGWLTVRIADALHLMGKSAEARDVLAPKLRELESNPPDRFIDSTDHAHPLAVMGTIVAALEGPAPAARWINRSLDCLFATNGANYPNLTWGLRRLFEAGVEDGEALNLLKALVNRMPEADFRGSLRGAVRAEVRENSARTGPAEASLFIDLSRDEYALRAREDSADRPPAMRFGIPIEIEVIAWSGLIRSALAGRISEDRFHIPRGLLIDLLWPDAPAELGLIDNRLSKLLARAGEVHGIELRDDSMKKIVGPRDPRLALTIQIAPERQKPSYLDREIEPTVDGFAEYYRMSLSNARRARNQLLASGLWSDSARKKNRRAA